MSEITKEELMAMIEVQGKAAQAMENIANSLRLLQDGHKDIVAAQKEMIKAAGDGHLVCEKIICEKIETATLVPKENKVLLQNVKADTTWIKIIFGSIAFITAIGVAIAQVVHWGGHAPKP